MGSPMRRYYFNLKQHLDVLPDLYGTDLPDEAAALEHARNIVLELMRNAQHEPDYGDWQ